MKKEEKTEKEILSDEKLENVSGGRQSMGFLDTGEKEKPMTVIKR